MLMKYQKHQAIKLKAKGKRPEVKGKRQKAKGKNIFVAQWISLCLVLCLLPLTVAAQEDCENKPKSKSKLAGRKLDLPKVNEATPDAKTAKPTDTAAKPTDAAKQNEATAPLNNGFVPQSANSKATGVANQNSEAASQATAAQDATTQKRPLPSAERVGVNVAEQTPITLDEAIALALANNKDINASRIDVEMARFDLNGTKGAYDPKVSVESYYEHRETAVSSVIGGSASGKVTSTDSTSVARLSGNSPLAGGIYQIDFSSTRQTTDNQFASLNPQYPSGVTLTYTQPLFKGLKTDDNRRRIEIAKKNLSLTDSQFRQRAIEIITRVQQAYWDLVFALRNLQVQNDAVTQARTQLDSNKRQVEQGTLAPIDIVSAEAQVTLFEQTVYVAQEGVTRAENNLKLLMLPERKAELWAKALLPTTPVDLDAPRVELGEAVSIALASRPELEQVAKTAEINKVNQKYFSDQLKPQVDLFGVYTSAGLAGTLANTGPNPFTAGTLALTERVNQLSQLAGLPNLPTTQSFGSIPSLLIGGYGQSLTNLFGQNFPTARVGIRFSLPVGNRTAEANLGRSLAESRKIQNQREQLEQSIEADVRNTLQAVRSAQARLVSATASRDATEKQYESERRKFQAGLSTVFLVLQRQQELIAARGREVQAQTDLNKSIADFQRATGSTFKAHNITVKSDQAAPQLEQNTK
jgi:HAE1 family hydrophobic/amphiphilic exporter-1